MPDAIDTLPIQLICTDFDGTLFAECDDPPVPMVLQQMIGGLQARGARWVINTGRDLEALSRGMAEARMSIRPDYLVVLERDIYEKPGVSASLSSSSSVPSSTSTSAGGLVADYLGLEDWNRTCAERHASLFLRVRRDIPRLLSQIAMRCVAAVHEDPLAPFSFVCRMARDTPVLIDILRAYCRRVPGLAVVQSHLSARFCHARYNKGTALAEIGRRIGIARDFIFAAGDHFNDLPMMSTSVARWLMAPGNAIEQVKDSVRRQQGYVSHQPCGYGVACGLAFFLGAEADGPASGRVLARGIGD